MTDFYKYFGADRDDPKAVIRVKDGAVERYDLPSGAWQWYPEGISFTGIGGSNNYMKVSEAQAMKIIKRLIAAVERGGAGSGNFGHAGRPGQVGGSAPASGASGNIQGGAPGNLGMQPVIKYPDQRSSEFLAERRKRLGEIGNAYAQVKARRVWSFDQNMKIVKGGPWPTEQFYDRLKGGVIMYNTPNDLFVGEHNVQWALTNQVDVDEIVAIGPQRQSGLRFLVPPSEMTPARRKQIHKATKDAFANLTAQDYVTDWKGILGRWKDLSSEYDELDFWWDKTDYLMGKSVIERGGPGSGNFGHGGLKGVWGGSSSGGSATKKQPGKRVGITSARPDKDDPEAVYKDMEDFQKELSRIRGVSGVTVEPGRGGWEGGSEPSWVVAYDGNGQALKLLAQTGKQFNQDAVLLYEQDDSEDASPLTDYRFGEAIDEAERNDIENLLVAEGIGGWTWFRDDDGNPVLRLVYVPQWADNSKEEHLSSTKELLTMLNGAGYNLSREDDGVKVTIMENDEGENGYDSFLD